MCRIHKGTRAAVVDQWLTSVSPQCRDRGTCRGFHHLKLRFARTVPAAIIVVTLELGEHEWGGGGGGGFMTGQTFAKRTPQYRAGERSAEEATSSKGHTVAPNRRDDCSTHTHTPGDHSNARQNS